MGCTRKVDTAKRMHLRKLHIAGAASRLQLHEALVRLRPSVHIQQDNLLDTTNLVNLEETDVLLS